MVDVGDEAPDSLDARSSRTPGDVIAGRYLLEARLAEGGIGEVWRAKHVHLKQHLAIKLLREAETAGDPELRASVLERFRFEAQVSALLAKKTVHVVAVHDAGECEAGPFLAMEFVEGKTLHDDLADDGPMSPLRFGLVLAQVVDALSAAHSVGIVHRDLKPSNILVQELTARPEITGRSSFSELREGPFVKVADFGIAKTAEVGLGLDLPKDTAVTALVGTPDYMSPEQLRGEGPDLRMDVWALGVVAYQTLTGFMPFEAPSMTELMVQIMVHPFVPATQRRAGLPAALDGWFDRALAKAPGDRFGTAMEMLGAYVAAVPGAEEVASGPFGRRSSPSLHSMRPFPIARAATLPPTSVDFRPVPSTSPMPSPTGRQSRALRVAPWLGLVAAAAITSGWLAISRTRAEAPGSPVLGASAQRAEPPAPDAPRGMEVTPGTAATAMATPPGTAARTGAPEPSAKSTRAVSRTSTPPSTASALPRVAPGPRPPPPADPAGRDPSGVF